MPKRLLEKSRMYHLVLISGVWTFSENWVRTKLRRRDGEGDGGGMGMGRHSGRLAGRSSKDRTA